MDTGDFDIARVFRSSPDLPRIRIAILDTGYDPESRFFSLSVRQNRLKEWKDFTKFNLEPIDEDGHGTYVVSLAMRMAPAADIYVARVAKNSDGLREAGKSIADVR